MTVRTFLVWAGVAALLAAAWRAFGWAGIALTGGGLVMWLLLHFTRITQVMSRAAQAPLGHVGSAVMLNAKLKHGVNLLHVLALTRALGQQLSPREEQPEIYRWTDAGGSHVTCEFRDGKLVHWQLVRPEAEAEAASPAAVPPLPAP